MVLNPCCCALQKGCKVIAVIQIIGSILILITSILALIGVTHYYEEAKEANKNWDKDNISKTVLIVVCSLLLVGSLVNLVLAIVLWQGARDKNRTKCKIWLFVSIIILILMIARFVIDCVHVRTGQVLDLVQSVIGIFIDAYCIFVVYCFVQEVKNESNEAA